MHSENISTDERKKVLFFCLFLLFVFLKKKKKKIKTSLGIFIQKNFL